MIKLNFKRDNMRRYKHFKGNTYIMLGTAVHTETLEELVIYCDKEGNTWARPKDMFFGTVEADGKEVPRFEPLEKIEIFRY